MKTISTASESKASSENEYSNINCTASLMWKNTLDVLKQRVDDDAMDKWFYCFSVEKIKKDCIVFRYTGNGDMAEFEKEWHKVLSEALFEVLGHETKIKIKQSGSYGGKRGFFRTLRTVVCIAALFCAAAVVVILGMNYISNITFEETFYQVGSGKINGNLRIIQLSDLHNAEFGDNNDTLVERIALLKPDIIVATGDMIEKNKSADGFVSLCERLTEIAPVYVVYGNNETDSVYGIDMTHEELDSMTGGDPQKLVKSDDELKAALEAAGATVLLNGQATVKIGENTIDIYGVLTTNTSAFWEYCSESYDSFLNAETDHFKLMLCHEPYIFEEFGDGYWGDLMLSGHTHGGVIRIPYLGGLYERKNGFFPESNDEIDAYIAGEYDFDGSSLIVSRGLTNKGLIRISNKPELVVIDVNRY